MDSRRERAIDTYLRSIGLDPQPNPAEPAGEGDRLIGGERTEYKTVNGVQNPSSDTLSGAIANRAMNARSQAAHVVIDARDRPGMTSGIAARGIRRAFGADKVAAARQRTTPRIESVRVIIRGASGTDADLFVPRDEGTP